MTTKDTNYLNESDYTADQWQEIEEGILNGLDVSLYAKKEYYAIQMMQIRLGLMEKLPVEYYATTDYDWFQMEEIRLGLSSKVDISKYAQPEVPFDIMRQIRKGLEQGIDLSHGRRFPSGVLKELRIALSHKTDISRFIREGYDQEQLEQIRTAYENRIDIDRYINISQRGAVIKEIRLGLEKNLDVDIYARTDMNWQQMREIRLGLEHRVDVRQYDNPLYAWNQMRQIRLGLEDELPVEDYKSFMYTAFEMEKHRLKLKEAASHIPANKENEKKEYEDFVLVVSASQMEAFIIVSEVSVKIKSKDIVDALAADNVVYGIDYDKLDEIEKDGASDEMIIVATGTEPGEGKDGWYEYTFDTDIKAKPKLLENGAVDYQNIKCFELVKTDQIVARYHGAAPGKEGKKVTGETITGMKGKELPPLVGTGFTVLPDNVTYVSQLDGKVELRNGRLEITGILVLDNVTQASGNVIFNGSVYVKGMVGEGSVIKAGKDIIVDGFTEAAMFDAGGDVILRKGNNQGGKGYIRAMQDVMGNFFENAKIICGGSLKANYCLNSEVYAEKTIEISGNRAVLAGGNVHAGEAVMAYNIGNEAGVITRIKAGKEERFLRDKAALDKRESNVKRELTLLRNALKDIRRNSKVDEKSGNALYVKIENAIYTKENELKDIYEAKNRLKEEEAKMAYVKVVLKGNVYPGVNININGASWRASKVNNITLKNKDGKIAIYRNGGRYEF